MNPERFGELADLEADQIPEAFYEELNLGILIEESSKRHSAAPGLLTLGEYRRGPEGNQIILYYGSFMEYCGRTDEAFWQKKIREVLRREFRHHMEGRSGIRDLEYEDQKEIEEYLKTTGKL